MPKPKTAKRIRAAYAPPSMLCTMFTSNVAGGSVGPPNRTVCNRWREVKVTLPLPQNLRSSWTPQVIGGKRDSLGDVSDVGRSSGLAVTRSVQSGLSGLLRPPFSNTTAVDSGDVAGCDRATRTTLISGAIWTGARGTGAGTLMAGSLTRMGGACSQTFRARTGLFLLGCVTTAL